MRFALAGNNPTAFHVLRELASSPEHRLIHCAIGGELAAITSRGDVPVALATSAEEALLTGEIDIAVVAIDDLDESLRMVRAASQSARHVVVIPPALCSPAYSFELHLILDESQCGIMPLLPRIIIPEIPLTAVDLQLDSHATRQLAIELPLPATTPAALQQQVNRGLDYLSASGFKYDQVTALETNAPDGSLLSRLITLNAAPTSDAPLPPATLTIKPSNSSEQNCILQISGSTNLVTEISISATTSILNRIVAVCESRELCGQWMDAFSVTLELSEAVNKSLRRRRTVDVHFDSGSEKGVFKSQMTAIGCGILIFMMLGMVAFLILAQLVTLPKPALYALRILWMAPLVLFLIAQALLPLARDRSIRE